MPFKTYWISIAGKPQEHTILEVIYNGNSRKTPLKK